MSRLAISPPISKITLMPRKHKHLPNASSYVQSRYSEDAGFRKWNDGEKCTREQTSSWGNFDKSPTCRSKTQPFPNSFHFVRVQVLETILLGDWIHGTKDGIIFLKCLTFHMKKTKLNDGRITFQITSPSSLWAPTLWNHVL
mmetsp:Transcript_49178/g.73325  ORF Transcript_49178/g.73325 Transcript_49178/m.73325 type:complete len:142 (+) Transcript_49178:125-550(+)